MERIVSLCKMPLAVLLVTVMVAGGLFVGFPQEASASEGYLTATVYASADTYLRGGADNTNEGASPFLRVQGNGKNCVLVRFDQDTINEAVNGGEIISAYLEMDIFEAKDNWSDGRTVDVHRLTMDWAEGNGRNAEIPDKKDFPGITQYRGDGAGATWNCAIDADISNGNDNESGSVKWEMDPTKSGNPWIAVATDTVTITNDVSETVRWNVTDDVKAFLDGEDNFGWIVKKTKPSASGHAKFFSKENGPISGPRLIITYVPAPGVREVTLYSTKDSHLRQGSPNTNEGANPSMRIQASGNNRVVVGFDLSEIDTAGLVKATLILTLMENSDNWGKKDDRTVDAHRLLTDWVEGNGKNDELKKAETYRGDGEGVTWNCPVDTDISNQKDDGDKWDMANPGKVNKQGGYFAAATAPGVVHYNGLTGEVKWDVTEDVLAGAEYGWLIKKTNEGASGKVIYYSREGAAEAGNPDLAPRLILIYGEIAR